MLPEFASLLAVLLSVPGAVGAGFLERYLSAEPVIPEPFSSRESPLLNVSCSDSVTMAYFSTSSRLMAYIMMKKISSRVIKSA
ncbi:hypothetical protein D3C85_1692660 [compost metagenome]